MTAGTVTQSGNGRVAGVLVTTTGAPASGTQVKLFPSDFNPVINGAIVPVETTDTNGHYAFDGIKTGSYNVVAIQPDQKVQAATFGINVVSGDTFIVPPDTMRITGSIKIVLPTTVDTVNGYFFIPGTTIFSLINDHIGTAILDSVPAGVNLSIYYAVKGNSTQPQLVRDSVEVTSGGIMNIEYIGWIFSKKLILNTTASGAGVVGNVTDFPVLVRLTSANFKFTEAKQDGADLRFTKADGSPLPFEIETWDGANSAAAVWVKIDTVFGNDSTHFINMFWGNSNATSASNSASVFDTVNGFQGVWHLNEAAGLPAKDATGNHFDGTPSDTAPTAVSGAVGIAQEFNGMSNSLQMKGTASGKLNFAENANFTVSAWVYVDTLIDSATRLIVGKGPSQYYMKLFSGGPQKQWEFSEFVDNIGYQILNYIPAVARSWKYLVGIRDGSNQYLYLDGVLVNSNISTLVATGSRDTSNNVTIGRYLQNVTESNQGFAFFKGTIDEVRISSVSCSADWIKLCYMNQKVPDALLK